MNERESERERERESIMSEREIERRGETCDNNRSNSTDIFK